MSEERAEYTVHPDVAIRLETSEKYIKHLTSTIDGMTMVMGRHADTITAQRERIAELEATVARLEADNRRLRHLDAMPVDAMRRYWVKSDWLPDYLDDNLDACSADFDEINVWLTSRDGDA